MPTPPPESPEREALRHVVHEFDRDASFLRGFAIEGAVKAARAVLAQPDSCGELVEALQVICNCIEAGQARNGLVRARKALAKFPAEVPRG